MVEIDCFLHPIHFSFILIKHVNRVTINPIALIVQRVVKMRKHITVSAAVIIQNKMVFCAQRKDQGELAQKWEFPGGKLEIGEIPENALIREIKEELDSTISILEKLTTVEHQYTTFDITMHAFLCQLVDGSLTLSEHLDSRWLSKDQLFSVDWAEADIPIVEIVKSIL